LIRLNRLDMSRRVIVVKSLILMLLLGMSIALAGCEEFTKEEDFLDVKVKPEQTREIKTLKLEEKKDPNEGAEVNKPTQGEIKLSIEQCRAMTLKNNLDLRFN